VGGTETGCPVPYALVSFTVVGVGGYAEAGADDALGSQFLAEPVGEGPGREHEGLEAIHGAIEVEFDIEGLRWGDGVGTPVVKAGGEAVEVGSEVSEAGEDHGRV